MTQPLIVVIPLSTSEIGLTASLLAHLAKHPPIHHHAVLFVADHGLDATAYQPILDAARPTFPAGGSLIHTSISVPNYPQAHNLRFETALRHIGTSIKAPFLFLSPRCVPTRAGWLIELETEYGAHAKTKPILGQLLTPETHGTAHPLIASTAIYPYDLPKRVTQLLIAQRSIDFEKSCASMFVPLAHPTQLIWNQPVDGRNAMPTPPSVASLVHTVRARDYALALHGGAPLPRPVEKVIVPTADNTPFVKKVAPESVPQAWVKNAIVEPRSAYYHSGDLGDIVYALAAIKLAGGGKLILGPQSKRTPPPANPMREDQFQRFKPLLEAQPYLNKVVFSERHPGTDAAFDLNQFREQWGDQELRKRTGIKTLVRMHCHLLGVDEKHHPGDTWMTIPSPIATGMFTCHRSARYRATEDNAFPWEMIVKRYAKRLLFVGLPAEHADFQRSFNCRVAFWCCADFLDLARVIVGSLGFIGNQSFPNSIALACGQRVLQESWGTSPDCVLPRPNFKTQPFAEGQLTVWEASTLPVNRIPNPRIDAVVPEDSGMPVKLSIPSQRLVTTDSPIELGPQLDADGLGDTLAITPLAAALGKKATMCLPKSMERFAPLFDGLCQTKITEDCPRFPNPGKERFIESKLRMFGIRCENAKTVPVIKLKGIEKAHAGNWVKPLRGLDKPLLIFHTTCSKEWSHVRSRPREWFEPIRVELSKHFTLVNESPATLAIRTLAARYSRIGLYFGVNTGNWHLAMAVGCKCLVVDADECDGYNPALWRYDLPSCEYVGFDVQNVIAKIPWLLDKQNL